MSGNNYMVVEVAGATPKDLQDLIGKQGKFEAKIGNDTVFIGGKQQVTSVCKNDPSCAAIRECSDSSDGSGSYCTFDFVIYLSPEAAQRQANLTSGLSINITQNGDRILSKTLDLYLDDNLVDSLQISSDLKGKASTEISIRGPGVGSTKTEAYAAATANMAKLQTVLITGSLPYKLTIVKLDNISPLLGKQFVNNILLAAIAAAIGVALIIFIRYRKLSFTIPVVLTVLSEIFIILGMASLIQWNLDLASIAGIIAAIGTGVDAQVIIIDESRKTTREYSLKERIKGAFFIILGSFSTLIVAMLPLFWAGAGMMKGFALTTILGACIGVIITRPAFSDIISQITKE
jgi:preprotein translocase subunit SecD